METKNPQNLLFFELPCRLFIQRGVHLDVLLSVCLSDVSPCC